MTDFKPPIGQRTAAWMPVAFLLPATLFMAGLCPIAHAEEPAPVLLRGRILDAATGDPIPARVHIQDADGRWYTCESEGGTAAPYRKEPEHVPGSVEVNTALSAHPFTVELAPGRYTFRVERGKEYAPIIRKITVSGDMPAQKFRLQRWINMADRDWYSGDIHSHRTGEELEIVLPAEDLNVVLPKSYWVTRDEQLPDHDGVPKGTTPGQSLIEIDPTHVIYPVNTEYEITSVGGKHHSLGAVLVLNHKTPLDLKAPPVAPIAARARAEGALLDLEKHSWAWSLMLVPVMGVDLFELGNNHHWQTKFGFTQWTLGNAPADWDLEMRDGGFTERGWTDFGFKTYYALLNCGYRLRVSAGTASGVHPVQLGFNRVYVHLPEGFSYDAWMNGLNAGRSFATNGPLLNLRFNGQDAGCVFTAPEGESVAVRITGSVFSLAPLDRIEIVCEGDVAQILPTTNSPLPNGGFKGKMDATLTFERSSWIAVRCFESNPEGRVRFAHTNPVFIDVAGKPLRPKAVETVYFVERMEEELARNRGVLDAASVAEYEQALAAYREKAAQAR